MKVEARLATETDAPQFVEWMTSTENNLFDPAIGEYPNLRTVAIEQNGQPVWYAPFHPVLAVESIAHKPGLTPKQSAIALRKFQDTIEELARAYGIREIYFMCADETLTAFASRHGYDVLKCKVLRKKVTP